jgi:hypothetical protein
MRVRLALTLTLPRVPPAAGGPRPRRCPRGVYLADHKQPERWRATISHGRLVPRRELVPDAWLQAAAW